MFDQKFDPRFESRAATSVSEVSGRVLEVNSVLRNAYFLLALTLLFCGGMAWYAVAVQAGPIHPVLYLLGVYGLLYGIQATRDSALSIGLVFAFTGLTGYALGPLLEFMLGIPNGGDVVMASAALTGGIFLGLSCYALISRKDFSYMGGFLVGLSLTILGAILFGIFLNIPALHLLTSCAIALMSAGYILYDTSAAIHGGQRNYVLLTVGLFLNIYNLFLSLLQILGAVSGGRRND